MSKKINDLVDARDGYRCVRCGVSLVSVPGSRHHRVRRRDTADKPSVLVLLCGSGTTGCHGWAHAHPKAARRLGLIVPAVRRPPLDTTTIPCVGIRHDGKSGWFLLDDEGGRSEIPAALATELLEAAGMFTAPEVAA